ncbi:putative peptidoglycan binding domain protein [Bacillus paralicheniformis]|nr:putative peptidoglycan binding domain protein [Bacillus paralicheniformis]
MKGTAVRQIQKALATLYFYPEKGAKNNGIDGYYGPKTANAVKRFQLMYGLSADGIYGPKTKAKLESLLQ